MIEKTRIIEQNNRKKNFYLPKICISKYFFVPLRPKYVFFYRSCACERVKRGSSCINKIIEGITK